MKHVGKMKNNGARIVIAYRTLPGDPYNALVIGTSGLMDSYHDSLMSLLESDAAQQANELADIMAVRRFPDGSNMLHYVHTNGLLKKVATSGVLVTPDNKTAIPLDELNSIIAQQQGTTIEQLAIKDSVNSTVATLTPDVKKESVSSNDNVSKTTSTSGDFDLSAAEMRSRADALYKEAARLRKSADDIDPPKKKTTKETV